MAGGLFGWLHRERSSPARASADKREHRVNLLAGGEFCRVAFYEWGAADNPRTVFCLHGLTSNGAAFDYLARALAPAWRVICPDLPGRGESGWLSAKSDYQIGAYVTVCAGLIAHLGLDELAWVGTSMGGQIGMVLASLPNTPIRRMVINDIGPVVETVSHLRIAAYTGLDPRFTGIEEAEKVFRAVGGTLGIKRDEHWRHLTVTSTRPADRGLLRLHYDPGLAEPFRKGTAYKPDYWKEYDAIRCPTLLLRGADSDLLSPATAEAMTRRGPKAEMVTIPDCGHAPMLLEDDQIAIVRDWLDRPAPAPAA